MASFAFVDFDEKCGRGRGRGSGKLYSFAEKAAKDAIVVINFLRYPPAPTEDELTRALAKLAARQKPIKLVFINFKLEGKIALAQDTSLRRILNERNTVIPVFDRYSRFVCFFGLDDKQAEDLLSGLLHGRQLRDIDLKALMRQKGDRIGRLLQDNPWLFQAPTVENPSWSGRITPRDLFNSEVMHEASKVGAHITEKHIQLMSGHHTSEFIQTNRIFKDIHFPIRLARSLYSKLEGKIDFDTISTFSLTGLDFARAFQREIEQLTALEVELVCLENYNSLRVPPTFSGPLSGRKVFVLSDVNNTGGLLESMVSFWEECSSSEVVGIGVAIDTGNYNGELRRAKPFYSLCSWDTPIYGRQQECPLCQRDERPVYYIDEDTLSLSIQEEPHSVPGNLEELADKHPEVKAFWHDVAKSGALVWHARITTGSYKDRHYLAFVDTGMLLRDKEIRSDTAGRIIDHYSLPGQAFPFDLIVCPRNHNSMLLAQEVREKAQLTLGVPVEKVIAVPRQNEFSTRGDLDQALMEKASRALIIDDGANTGKTLSGLLYLLEKRGKKRKEIEACVLVDRLIGDALQRISRLFGKDGRFHAVHRMKVPPFVENVDDCPLCREAEILDADIRQSESSLVHLYCSARKIEVETTTLPAQRQRKEVSEKDQVVQWHGIKLPWYCFRALMLDLVNREDGVARIMDLLPDIKDPEVCVAVIEAMGMLGVSKETWLRHLESLLDVSNRLQSYEIKKTVFRTVIVSRVRPNRLLKDSMVNFILENLSRSEEVPFLAWLAYKVGDPIFRDRIADPRTPLPTAERANLRKIVDSIDPDPIVTTVPQMVGILETAAKIAETDVSVLIRGESGTGKELIARRIHRQSHRVKGPFIEVNCGGLSEQLLESELFGHEKGSFTGALAKHVGKLELANGGTLFLDEVGDMSPKLQVDLLRVLEMGSFHRVGGNELIKTDIRVIAATHQDLEKLTEQRRFREDLYFRLKVVEIRIPPLAERQQDIEKLAHHFLEKFRVKHRRKVVAFSPQALFALSAFKWRGNVRELKNVVEGAVVLARNEIIGIDDLPLDVRSCVVTTSDRAFQTEKTSLNPRQRKILDWIKAENREVNNRLYRDIAVCSKETARRDLNDLVHKKILTCTGKGPRTSYKFSE